MKIYISPYQLTRKTEPNSNFKSAASKTQKYIRSGVLLKCAWDEGKLVGYADLCPWPDFGDEPLEIQLGNLKKGMFSEQIKQSINLTYRDAIARSKGINLLNGTELIKNNYLLTSISELVALSEIRSKLKAIRDSGYETIKVKISTENFDHELQLLKLIASECLELELKLRLDANAKLSYEQAFQLINILDSHLHRVIEYIEDPTPYDQIKWAEINKHIPVAIDQEFTRFIKNLNTQLESYSTPFSFIILKPAKADYKLAHEFATQNNFPMVYTSYMDHPVGQMHALSLFARQGCSTKLTAGCNTHLIFNENPYSQKITSNQLLNDLGIGFTDLLEGEKWQLTYEGENFKWEPSEVTNLGNQLNKLNNEQFEENLNLNSNKNCLLLNNRMSLSQRTQIENALYEEIKLHNISSHVWFMTSGTHQAKLVGISKQAILNSAKNVNEFFKITSSDIWLKMLPSFHVGGVGILARAHLSNSKVIDFGTTETQKWSPIEFTQLIEKRKVTLASVVPTQLFDLVKLEAKCPKSLRLLFVGGDFLSPEIYKKAKNLGWPVVLTYGMTETASMIAASCIATKNTNELENRKNLKKIEKAKSIKSTESTETTSELPNLKLLPNVSLKINNEQFIQIKSNALLSYYLFLNNNTLEHETSENMSLTKISSKLIDPKNDGWFFSEDRGSYDELSGLTLLGRGQDFIKVNGESVELGNIKSALKDFLSKYYPDYIKQIEVLALDHGRSGKQIVAVADLDLTTSKEIISKFNTKLMPYERITDIYIVDKIERSALGKVDWKKTKENLKEN